MMNEKDLGLVIGCDEIGAEEIGSQEEEWLDEMPDI